MLWVTAPKTPLKSPLVQGGTLFSSNVAPQRGMKNSSEIPLTKGGKKAKRQRSLRLQGGYLDGFWRLEQTTPWRPAPPPLLRGSIFIRTWCRNAA
jgi:hypothetical protein